MPEPDDIYDESISVCPCCGSGLWFIRLWDREVVCSKCSFVNEDVIVFEAED